MAIYKQTSRIPVNVEKGLIFLTHIVFFFRFEMMLMKVIKNGSNYSSSAALLRCVHHKSRTVVMDIWNTAHSLCVKEYINLCVPRPLTIVSHRLKIDYIVHGYNLKQCQKWEKKGIALCFTRAVTSLGERIFYLPLQHMQYPISLSCHFITSGMMFYIYLKFVSSNKIMINTGNIVI